MLTKHELRQLDRLLERAILAVQEHAIEQSWRADAMHAVKEKLVEGYHRNRHADALDILADLRETRDRLTQESESRRRAS